MYQTVTAIYRAGTFVLRESIDVPEDSEVELVVRAPLMRKPKITNPIEQARILRGVTRRMQNNPIPAGVPRFAREELHARS